jgi:hypothetical protein
LDFPENQIGIRRPCERYLEHNKEHPKLFRQLAAVGDFRRGASSAGAPAANLSGCFRRMHIPDGY